MPVPGLNEARGRGPHSKDEPFTHGKWQKWVAVKTVSRSLKDCVKGSSVYKIPEECWIAQWSLLHIQGRVYTDQHRGDLAVATVTGWGAWP